MPLQGDVTKNSYVKTQRLFTSSKQRDEQSEGTHEYGLVLSDAVTNVIAIELTGYSLPVDIAPSFLATKDGFPGNDKVDFALQAGALVKTFSFSFPNRKFVYATYTTMLNSILDRTVKDDLDFGTNGAYPTSFNILSEYDESTSIVVNNNNVSISFLWASGSNRNQSAYRQMGFSQADTTFASQVKSQTATQLTPYMFCDVFVKEFPELSPLKRIYFDGAMVARTDPNTSRTRLLVSQPVRTLQTLTIKLLLDGGIPAQSGQEHELNFTLFSMQPEINSIPSWLKQTFML